MRLRIACVHCRRAVAFVREVGLSALVAMATHLRRFHPKERLGADPSRDVILSHFSITPAEPDDEPPNAA